METIVPNCDILINKEGVMFYRGVEILRRKTVALFYQHLQMDAAGRYLIEIGKERCYVSVEDTAYAVCAVSRADGRSGAEECFHLLLSDDSTEKLNIDTLRIGKENVLYCKVKNDRFEARFSRPGYYQLAAHVDYDPLNNAYFITLNGQPHYIKYMEHRDA